MSESKQHHTGPSSTDACASCGGYDNNELEPRFLYTVCAKCSNKSPVEVSRIAMKAGFDTATSVTDESSWRLDSVLGDRIFDE